MNINENDQIITGGSMAQETRSIDPLHMFGSNENVDSDNQNQPYPFSKKDIKYAEALLKYLGSFDRVFKIYDYLKRKEDEYINIANDQSATIDGIASQMDTDSPLDLQNYMNKTTNPGADGPY
jgi:hypothetical protein